MSDEDQREPLYVSADAGRVELRLERDTVIWERARRLAHAGAAGAALSGPEETLALSYLNSLSLAEREDFYLLNSAALRAAKGEYLPGNPIVGDVTLLGRIRRWLRRGR